VEENPPSDEMSPAPAVDTPASDKMSPAPAVEEPASEEPPAEELLNLNNIIHLLVEEPASEEPPAEVDTTGEEPGSEEISPPAEVEPDTPPAEVEPDTPASDEVSPPAERIEWDKFLEDFPDKTIANLEELTTIACQKYPDRKPLSLRESLRTKLKKLARRK